MKLLKILLLLLLPSLGFVACKKCDVKPSTTECLNTSANATVTENETTDLKAKGISEREAVITELGSTDIVGSGDDDRDGGDKRKKGK